MQAAPARIVFFRDGLSEGEFEGVGAEEVKAIQGTDGADLGVPLLKYINSCH